MANEVGVNITAQEDVSSAVENVAESTRDASRIVVNSMGSTEEAFDTAARSSGKFGAALDMASGAGSQLAGGIGDLGDGIQSVIDLQSAGAERARAYARAENDVAQAYVDGTQAGIDLKQSQIDLNQSRVDGKQYALDAEQAQADANQAMIDAEGAQTAYNDAVKEFGPGSIEAKQAAADLNQANLDLKQANIDAEQSTVDMTQSQADAEQALADTAQAGIDAKGSALDLAEAQSEVATQSSGWGQLASQAGMVAPVIMSVVGAVDLLALANTALHGTFVKTAASAIASRVAIMASSVASGVATAAQWLWNIAMMANPLGLIIAGIVLLVGAIILIATKTTWFGDLWNAIWGFMEKPVKWLVDAVVTYVTFMWNVWTKIIGAVRDFFVGAFKWAVDMVVGYFNIILGIPQKIIDFFSNLGGWIIAPFKWAFNWIAGAWNNTVGKLSFRIPDWVPGMGGAGFSMPRLPTLATGGDVTRSGMAMIHKGERVVPAGTRGLGASGGGSDITLVIDLSGAPEELRQWIKKNTKRFGGRGNDSVQIAWS